MTTKKNTLNKDKYFSKYGKLWPVGTTEATVEFKCFRDDVRKIGVLPRHQHLLNAISKTFPELDRSGNSNFVITPWTVRRAKILERHMLGGDRFREYSIWWGPAAVGKTKDLAAFALSYYLAAPKCTTVLVFSTSAAMLKAKFFSELSNLHNSCREKLPGRIYPSDMSLRNSPNDSKNGIYCRAIERKSLKEAMGDKYGIHNRYVLVVVDELQNTHLASMESAANLSAGNDEFLLLAAGNPESWLDPLGQYSEPEDGDRKKVNRDDVFEWKSKMGYVYRFDGRQSPGVTDPKKYHFLLTQAQIDDAVKKWGPKSPYVKTQRYGLIPEEGSSTTPISENFITEHKFNVLSILEQKQLKMLACDPAYTKGGCICPVARADWGKDPSGKLRLVYGEIEEIKFELNPGKTISRFIGERLIQIAERDGIAPENIIVESTSIQFAVPDFIDDTLRSKICRVDVTRKPGEYVVSIDDPRLCCDTYRDVGTELFFGYYNYGRFGQIRNMPVDIQRDIVRRTTIGSYPIALTRKREDARVSVNQATAAFSTGNMDYADVGALFFYRLRQEGCVPGDGGDSPTANPLDAKNDNVHPDDVLPDGTVIKGSRFLGLQSGGAHDINRVQPFETVTFNIEPGFDF